jgi:hypothetical protein
MPEGQEQVAIIVDYKSATSSSNPSIGTGLKVLNILQNHYVERLGRGLVVNMPWWINAFFSGITPFMDPITRDKIRFNPKLTELIDANQLDKEYGGDYNFEFDHAVYWPALTEFCCLHEDGSRVDKDGENWIPRSGNGATWALDQRTEDKASATLVGSGKNSVDGKSEATTPAVSEAPAPATDVEAVTESLAKTDIAEKTEDLPASAAPVPAAA